MSKTIIRCARSSDIPYFMMSRALAQDRSISFEARGVMAYLLSKPDDWVLQPSDLEQLCGKSRVYRVLNELKDAKYLELTQERSGKLITRWVYIVHERPQLSENQEVESQEIESQLLENQDITYKRKEQNPESNRLKKKDSASSKKKDYEDVAHDMRTGIIAAWIDNLSAPPVGNSYANTTNHRLAAALVRAGYTAADVSRYTVAMGQDAFWHDKSLKLKHIADNLPAWVKAHPVKSAPDAVAAAGEGEIISPEQQEAARQMFEALVASKSANRKAVSHETQP